MLEKNEEGKNEFDKILYSLNDANALYYYGGDSDALKKEIKTVKKEYAMLKRAEGAIPLPLIIGIKSFTILQSLVSYMYIGLLEADNSIEVQAAELKAAVQASGEKDLVIAEKDARIAELEEALEAALAGNGTNP